MASSQTPGKAPKSILKKSSTGKQQEGDRITARNRELAMQHALLIQYRKDVEATVLKSIETLIDFPEQTKDPQLPNLQDEQNVKQHLSLFTPTDFDSAVEERNVDGKCGYMLCPRPNRKQNTSAKFRIVRAQNIKVVKKEELEKWCSEDCGKRALYLRVQLSETPVWERAEARDSSLKLYGQTELNESRGVGGLTKDLEQLALERGDKVDSFRTKSMDVQLKERSTDMVEAQPPSHTDAMQIEGYTMGMAKDRRRSPLDIDLNKLDMDEDMLDTI
jgi:RNA polymerase II-associated protein 2